MHTSDRTRSTEELTTWSKKLQTHNEFLFANVDKIHPEYIQGFNLLDLNESRIPSLHEINLKLSVTDWKAVWVASNLSLDQYAKYILKNKVPLNHDQPELFHDIALRLPMLFSKEYTKYLTSLCSLVLRAEPNLLDHAMRKAIERHQFDKVAQIAERLREHPSELSQLTRMFFWTIDNGAMGTRNKVKLYGSKLLMNADENFSRNGKFELTYNSSEFVRDHNFLQNKIYVASDFNFLKKVLKDYGKGMSFHHSTTASL
jgi:phenylalanine-4-hydroxylase